MAAVPVILDKVYKGINANIKKAGPFTAKLFDFCLRYRANWIKRGYDTPIMNRLIFSKPRALLGGRVRVMLSGGAPLAEEAHHFIRTALGVTMLQGYGLTETCSTAAITEEVHKEDSRKKDNFTKFSTFFRTIYPWVVLVPLYKELTSN